MNTADGNWIINNMSTLKVEDLGRVVEVEYDYTYKANDGREIRYIYDKKSLSVNIQRL